MDWLMYRRFCGEERRWMAVSGAGCGHHGASATCCIVCQCRIDLLVSYPMCLGNRRTIVLLFSHQLEHGLHFFFLFCNGVSVDLTVTVDTRMAATKSTKGKAAIKSTFCLPILHLYP